MRDPGQNYRGCLLGGAVGDALGAAVEFESLAAIRAKHGPAGIADFDVAYGRRGAITDDTQMTLFTAEGLLRAHDGRAEVTEIRLRALKDAYLRWLFTQGERLPGSATVAAGDGLLQHPELHARRGPGNKCLTALRTSPAEGLFARNDSKGCGGPMRVAPVALLVHALGGHTDSACRLGAAAAAIPRSRPDRSRRACAWPSTSTGTATPPGR